MGIPIGVKSIGKWLLQSKFGMNLPDSEKISLCVEHQNCSLVLDNISYYKSLCSIKVPMQIEYN